jgi:hypothetical protein
VTSLAVLALYDGGVRNLFFIEDNNGDIRQKLPPIRLLH